MRRLAIVSVGGALLAAVLGACSSSSDATERFLDCSLNNVTGNWRFNFEQKTGDCGSIPSANAEVLGEIVPIGEGCTELSRDLSKDNCNLTVTIYCESVNPPSNETTAYQLTQTSEKTIKGTIKTSRQNAERRVCKSEYSMEVLKR